MTDARAQLGAWMLEYCEHRHSIIDAQRRHECPDCLLAYGAAQRAEEREECALIAVGHCWEATDMKPPGAKWQHATAAAIATLIRARREGPG